MTDKAEFKYSTSAAFKTLRRRGLQPKRLRVTTVRDNHTKTSFCIFAITAGDGMPATQCTEDFFRAILTMQALSWLFGEPANTRVMSNHKKPRVTRIVEGIVLTGDNKLTVNELVDYPYEGYGFQEHEGSDILDIILDLTAHLEKKCRPTTTNATPAKK